MNKQLKVKVIIGFREDQFFSIDAEEAHKAYFLFLHPKDRGIFSNGKAVLGEDIRGIDPDYHGTMGWNYTHKLDSFDLNEISATGIDRKLREAMNHAREVADLGDKNLLNLPLSEVVKAKGLDKLSTSKVDKGSGVARIGELLK